jgi:hypothetical protein
MIHIEKRGQTIILTRGDQRFVLPASEAPRLIAELLAELGIAGSRYQQDYQTGVQDGLLEGYERRDREYIVAATKAQRAAEREALAALPAAEARCA